MNLVKYTQNLIRFLRRNVLLVDQQAILRNVLEEFQTNPANEPVLLELEWQIFHTITQLLADNVAVHGVFKKRLSVPLSVGLLKGKDRVSSQVSIMYMVKQVGNKQVIHGLSQIMADKIADIIGLFGDDPANHQKEKNNYFFLRLQSEVFLLLKYSQLSDRVNKLLKTFKQLKDLPMHPLLNKYHKSQLFDFFIMVLNQMPAQDIKNTWLILVDHLAESMSEVERPWRIIKEEVVRGLITSLFVFWIQMQGANDGFGLISLNHPDELAAMDFQTSSLLLNTINGQIQKWYHVFELKEKRRMSKSSSQTTAALTDKTSRHVMLSADIEERIDSIKTLRAELWATDNKVNYQLQLPIIRDWKYMLSHNYMLQTMYLAHETYLIIRSLDWGQADNQKRQSSQSNVFDSMLLRSARFLKKVGHVTGIHDSGTSLQKEKIKNALFQFIVQLEKFFLAPTQENDQDLIYPLWYLQLCILAAQAQIVEKMPDYKLQFLPQYFEPSSLDVEQSGINGGSASASKSHKQRGEQRFLWNVDVILDQVKSQYAEAKSKQALPMFNEQAVRRWIEETIAIMQQPKTSQNIDLAKNINNIIGQLKAVLNKAAPMVSVAESTAAVYSPTRQCSSAISDKVKPLVAEVQNIVIKYAATKKNKLRRSAQRLSRHSHSRLLVLLKILWSLFLQQQPQMLAASSEERFKQLCQFVSIPLTPMANDDWTLENYMRFKEIWLGWVEYLRSEKQCALSQLDIKTLQNEINDEWRSKIKPILEHILPAMKTQIDHAYAVDRYKYLERGSITDPTSFLMGH